MLNQYWVGKEDREGGRREGGKERRRGEKGGIKERREGGGEGRIIIQPLSARTEGTVRCPRGTQRRGRSYRGERHKV